MQKTKIITGFSSQEIKLFLLLLLWILGLIFGALAGAFSASNVPCLSCAFTTPASVVSLFLCAFSPFIFSACAVFFKKTFLIYFLAFVKAFAFSYTGCACLFYFYNFGWLARVFLLFTPIATIPALWYSWLSICRGRHKITCCSFIALCLYIALVAMLDHYCISPFLYEISS